MGNEASGRVDLVGGHFNIFRGGIAIALKNTFFDTSSEKEAAHFQMKMRPRPDTMASATRRSRCGGSVRGQSVDFLLPQ